MWLDMLSNAGQQSWQAALPGPKPGKLEDLQATNKCDATLRPNAVSLPQPARVDNRLSRPMWTGLALSLG